MQYADQRLGVFLNDLKEAGALDSTLVLLGSKQGQGPINPKNETYFPSDNITSVLEADGIGVALFTADDGGIMWLKDQSQAPAAKAKLLANSSLGVSFVLAGDEVQHAVGIFVADDVTVDMLTWVRASDLLGSIHVYPI